MVLVIHGPPVDYAPDFRSRRSQAGFASAILCLKRPKAQQGARANDHVRHAACYRTNLRNEPTDSTSSRRMQRAGHGRGSSLTLGDFLRGRLRCAAPWCLFQTLGCDRPGSRMSWRAAAHPEYPFRIRSSEISQRQSREKKMHYSPLSTKVPLFGFSIVRFLRWPNQAPEPTPMSVTPRAVS